MLIASCASPFVSIVACDCLDSSSASSAWPCSLLSRSAPADVSSSSLQPSLSTRWVRLTRSVPWDAWWAVLRYVPRLVSIVPDTITIVLVFHCPRRLSTCPATQCSLYPGSCRSVPVIVARRECSRMPTIPSGVRPSRYGSCSLSSVLRG